MLVVTYICFIVLSCAGAGAQWFAWVLNKQKEIATGNNPTFLQFQRKYYLAYLLALVADWLQGPYLYKLYRSYGFTLEQISVIYVCGFVSALLFGSWAPFVANQFGRKNLCVAFTALYSISCFMKLSVNYVVLIMSRVFSGVATSILFHTYEAWYVHEHIETNDFPKEWIPITFRKVSVWNGVLAVGAGLTANAVAEWFSLGPVAPSMLAIPFALCSGMVVMSMWKENYGNTGSVKWRKTCVDGLREIGESRRVLLIGSIQALFESVNCIFIFLWTPMLDVSTSVYSHAYKPSLGIVFSCFMVCTLIGSALHHIFNAKRVRLTFQMTIAISLAFFSNIICIFSAGSDVMQTSRIINLLAFFVFEVSIGLYFPTMSSLREEVIPEGHTAAIMSWFRVPLNILASAILIVLHGHHSGFYLIFVICAAQMLLALLCTHQFSSLHNAALEDSTQSET